MICKKMSMETLPSCCAECPDNHCHYWTRQIEDNRNPRCPLVKIPSYEEAKIILEDWKNMTLEQALHNLGFERNIQ